ncbi:hypothetical protein SFR_2501 [Streptomyces sp. FR-008]|nr:hypothetical protein SFR_2501 [Streptomyces sp. FR-008]
MWPGPGRPCPEIPRGPGGGGGGRGVDPGVAVPRLTDSARSGPLGVGELGRRTTPVPAEPPTGRVSALAAARPEPTRIDPWRPA